MSRTEWDLIVVELQSWSEPDRPCVQ